MHDLNESTGFLSGNADKQNMEITLNPARVIIDVHGWLCRQVLKPLWQQSWKRTFWSRNVQEYSKSTSRCIYSSPKTQEICLDTIHGYMMLSVGRHGSCWIIQRASRPTLVSLSVSFLKPSQVFERETYSQIFESYIQSQGWHACACCHGSLQQPTLLQSIHRCILTSVDGARRLSVAEISFFTPEGFCVSTSQFQCGLLDFVGFCC